MKFLQSILAFVKMVVLTQLEVQWHNCQSGCFQSEATGSGWGSVGRVVASDSRGLRFESTHWQNVYRTFNVNSIEKTKKIKRGREWPIFQKRLRDIQFESALVTLKTQKVLNVNSIQMLPILTMMIISLIKTP